MKNVVQQYLATWNATGDKRAALLAKHWSPETTYIEPLAAVAGRDGIAALVDQVHERFPGHVFTRVGEVDSRHPRVRLRWGLGPKGGEPVVIGFDVLELDAAGRIRGVRGVVDKATA